MTRRGSSINQNSKRWSWQPASWTIIRGILIDPAWRDIRYRERLDSHRGKFLYELSRDHLRSDEKQLIKKERPQHFYAYLWNGSLLRDWIYWQSLHQLILCMRGRLRVLLSYCEPDWFIGVIWRNFRVGSRSPVSLRRSDTMKGWTFVCRLARLNWVDLGFTIFI